MIIEKSSLAIIDDWVFRKEFPHISFPVIINENSFIGTEVEEFFQYIPEPIKPEITELQYLELGKPYLDSNDEIKVEYKIIDKLFTEQEKNNYLEKMNNIINSKLSFVKATYPESEIQSWPKQEAEAKAYSLDNSQSTPLIDAIANARGIPKDILISKIIEKAIIYANYTGNLIGLRQKLETQITLATNFNELPELP